MVQINNDDQQVVDKLILMTKIHSACSKLTFKVSMFYASTRGIDGMIPTLKANFNIFEGSFQRQLKRIEKLINEWSDLTDEK